MHEVRRRHASLLLLLLLFIFALRSDPFLDDNIDFARRLRSLQVPHQLTIVDQYPHGFLDFGFASSDIARFNIKIIDILQRIVRQSSLDPTGDYTLTSFFTS